MTFVLSATTAIIGIICCFLSHSSAFQQQQQQQQQQQYSMSVRKLPTPQPKFASSSTSSPSFDASSKVLSAMVSSSSSSAYFASDNDDDITASASTSTGSTNVSSVGRTLRTKLRRLTGFSFTVFRASLRSVTGMSFTALYASSLATTSLWIRQAMSLILRIFPSGVRYFVQPLLVLYYTPLVLVRYRTSPTRRKKVWHAYREAVSVAEHVVDEEGYAPLRVGTDGSFQLKAPPPPPPSSSSTSVVENDNE